MSVSLYRTLRRRAHRRTTTRLRLDNLALGLVNRADSDDSDDAADICMPVHGAVDADETVADNELGDCGSDSGANQLGDTGSGANNEEVVDAVPDADEALGNVLNRHDNEVLCVDSSQDSDEDVASNSDDSLHVFRSDAEKEQYVIDSVREWAQEPGVLSMSKLDDLLHRLSVVFPCMPLTYTTLFHCDYEFDISELASGGMLWYKGIRSNLNALYLEEYLGKFGKITLDIGMDGLPLKKVKLWPILGDLVGTDNAPFIIAVYRGTSDPVSVDEYLEKFVAELRDLLLVGFTYHGRQYKFEIRNFILDAIARSFVKCIVRPNGYSGCEKCLVHGEYFNNRVTFMDLDQPLRTDASFHRQEDPKHHKGVSPLEPLGTGMVTQFPLDPMHLVFGGVMKRLLEYWLYVVGNWKLHYGVVELISSVFVHLRPYCPVDFNRKPNSLQYFKCMKFTEMRRMLLYDGIVAFKDLVDMNVYKHFLLLHCSTYMLCSRSLFSANRDLIKELLRLFVTHAARIYSQDFVVYNVHSLIHLVDECDRGFTLDEISAFKFENRLKSVKETLRSGLHQLQQLARRDSEKETSHVKLTCKKTSNVVLSLKERNLQGRVAGIHFKKVKAGGLTLRIGKSDGCFKSKNGDVIILTDIVLRGKKVYLQGRKFNLLENFYDYPIPSSDLGIFRASRLGRENLFFRLRDVSCKCYLMPDGNHFFVVVRFYPTDEDENEYFEVALSKWIVGELDDDMIGELKWPPPTKVATPLIKLETEADPSWPQHKVEVMRFYDTFVKARAAVPKFIVDSNYETEVEMQSLGKRKRSKPRTISSSSSEEEVPIRKRAKADIPAPPPVLGKSPPAVSVVSCGNSKQKSQFKPRKGQGPTKEQLKKQEKEELMSRLKAAREVAAAKLRTPQQSSPWKITPLKSNAQKDDYQNDGLVNRSEPGEVENFLEINLETGTEDYEIPKVNSGQKSPTYRTFADLPDNTSFCLSPTSAKSVSNNIGKRSFNAASLNKPSTSVSHVPLNEGFSPASTVLATPVQDEPKSSGPLKSKTDGRRQLFPVQKKSVEERLQSIEATMLSLEVLARETSSKADIVLMNVGRLLRSLLPNTKRISKPLNLPKLPLGTRQELNTFEQFLGESDENLSAVCDYLSSYIRLSVADPERKSATAVLSHLLYNNLAKEMNLDGGNHKIGFRCLNIYKLFQGTLQTAFPKSDLTTAEDALRKWLKDAKWRKQAPVSTSSSNKTPSAA